MAILTCKSNKYEVIAHSQNNSLDPFMGSLVMEMLTCWAREKGFRAIHETLLLLKSLKSCSKDQFQNYIVHRYINLMTFCLND